MNVTRRGALSLVAASIGMGSLQACGKVATDANEQGQAEAAAPAGEAPATVAFPDDQRIAQARHNVRGDSAPHEPFALLHISDIHGDGAALGRALAWAQAHEGAFDDILATGDLAYKQFGDGMGFWSQVEGSERVLTCIGNHDVFEDPETKAVYDSLSVSDAAAQYIDAFASAWGSIDHEPGTTWYAKDYPDRGVRLVVLDSMVYLGKNSGREADAQNAWLESTLEDARGAGLTVVAADHYALAEESMVDCSWAPFDRTFAYGPFLASDIPQRVQTFIDAGGTFACYLCGHCHCDAAHTLPGHPEQFALTVPCTSDSAEQAAWGDMDRSQEATRDAFNLVVVDTQNKLVKALRIGADRDLALQRRTALSWDYARHRLVYAG